MLHFAQHAAAALSLFAAQATLGGAAALSQAGQQIPSNPLFPELTGPATEILALRDDGHMRYTIPVTIDGIGPYKFMIDTGSQATAVTERVTNEVSLPSLGAATVIGMASSRIVELVELDELEVGTRTIGGISAPVLQRQHVGADGIIGLDTLQDFRVVIDFRNETITVADAAENNSNRGFEIIVRAHNKLGQLLITDAIVEGVRATVIIDTGAQASLGNLALRDRIRSRRAAEQVKTTDVNGVSLFAELTYARSLKIDDFELSNVPITYADTPAFEALGLTERPALSLGMQHLKLFDRVAIDFAKKQILFDLPRNVSREIRRERSSSRI